MSNIQVPFIIFGHNKYIIKGGFWDGRIEINVINSDSKEEKDNVFYSIYVEEGPVIVMEISKDENLLLCGTLFGYIVAYQIEYINNNSSFHLNLIKKLYDHNNSINSISINDTLNMFATSANDEYTYLYLLPTFEIFRAIKVYNKYEEINNKEEELLIITNNVFLSSSPLPCITAFISSKKIFKSYTINGEYICENKESNNSSEIKCYNIFHDLGFSDYLIYGTNDGMVKIRSFPHMNLINSYNPFEYAEIVCLEISLDKRYCYAWSRGGEIAVIKDISVNDPAEVEQKKFKFK
jgi:WD40 repeat protein